jgi:hypothetical protein
MVVQERKLWPTWTSMPRSNLNLVNTVEVTFRIFGPPRHLNHEFSLFRPGDGGPPVIAWQFNDLLKRFVCLGPSGPIRKPEEAYARSVCGPSDDCSKSQKENKASVKHPFIKHLRLNVLTPTVFPEGVQIASEFARAGRDVEDEICRKYGWNDPPPELQDKFYVMHSRALACFLESHISVLEHYPNDYGKTLVQGVGNLYICIDGVEKDRRVVNAKYLY